MPREEKYILNEETQSYEADRRPVRTAFFRAGTVLMAGLACFLVYFYVFTQMLGYRTPKTLFLERRNRMLTERVSLLGGRIDAQESVLRDLEMRDNLVYRPVFGMDGIAESAWETGLGGEDRYAAFLGLDHQALMEDAASRVDRLTRKAYVQSLSFDEVKVFSGRAGDMASCIPSIYPVNPRTVQLTSPFGARYHPIRKAIVVHEGVDLAGPAGQPVYATGDGVVESAEINFSGYGNVIVIDHGFLPLFALPKLKPIPIIFSNIIFLLSELFLFFKSAPFSCL